ncbi:MAG: hypothetical protein QOD81_2707 [Solirubrobacteraceae bacterium]|jgi:hypothetical protein|nr:hypothetical protein [Solirubrobacteraceae bacterium]
MSTPTPAASSTRGAHGERAPAQLFALVGGATLVLVGLLGFVADASFDTGSQIDGGSLIGFEVNGIHNLVHIASGLLLLAGARRPGTARTVCLIFGVTYGVVTLIGLFDGDTVLGLFPVNPADNVLHIGLTVLALAFALMPDRDRNAAADRRL